MRKFQVTSEKCRAHRGRHLVKPSSQKYLKATITLVDLQILYKAEFRAPTCFGHIL
jgi:hypothetical protein